MSRMQLSIRLQLSRLVGFRCLLSSRQLKLVVNRVLDDRMMVVFVVCVQCWVMICFVKVMLIDSILVQRMGLRVVLMLEMCIGFMMKVVRSDSSLQMVNWLQVMRKGVFMWLVQWFIISMCMVQGMVELVIQRLFRLMCSLCVFDSRKVLIRQFSVVGQIDQCVMWCSSSQFSIGISGMQMVVRKLVLVMLVNWMLICCMMVFSVISRFRFVMCQLFSCVNGWFLWLRCCYFSMVSGSIIVVLIRKCMLVKSSGLMLVML